MVRPPIKNKHIITTEKISQWSNFNLNTHWNHGKRIFDDCMSFKVRKECFWVFFCFILFGHVCVLQGVVGL